MLGRKGGSSLLRLPIYARLPLRLSRIQPLQGQHAIVSRPLLSSFQRSFAAAGKPRKTAGEPTKPVKKAVKREAKSSKNDAASKKVKAKKTAAKKKPAAPKKRVLTEAQKEAKRVRLAKVKTSDLKKAALEPPSKGGVAAHNIFFKDRLNESKQSRSGSDRLSMRDAFRSIAAEYNALTPAQLEHYNHAAQQHNEAARAEYSRWVQSHTPEQILIANRARAALRRQAAEKGSRKTRYQPIQDERLIKRPTTAFVLFSTNRNASGDFTNIRVTERAKLIGQEWKALSESEKKKYKDLQAQDTRRYIDEYKSAYGQAPPHLKTQPA